MKIFVHHFQLWLVVEQLIFVPFTGLIFGIFNESSNDHASRIIKKLHWEHFVRLSRELPRMNVQKYLGAPVWVTQISHTNIYVSHKTLEQKKHNCPKLHHSGNTQQS